MRTFKLQSITETIGGTTLVKFAGEDNGYGFNVLEIRLSDAGRVISIGMDSRTLHSRDQRKGGGKPIARLSQAAFRRCRDMACAVVALRALGEEHRFPPQELDL